MTAAEETSQTAPSTTNRTQSSDQTGSSWFRSAQFLILSLLQSLSLALTIVAVVSIILLYGDSTLLVYGVLALGISLFLLLLSSQLLGNLQVNVARSQIDKKAELQDYLLTDSVDLGFLKAVRAKALEYSQELVNDYRKTRRNSRVIYYASQLLTIILSGVTPILVLLERGEVNAPWLRWLPVLFPALAAIVTSISTSFPFQESFIAANTTVELLEAEQEKFLLGITAPYRSYDLADEKPRRQKAKKAIENFIVQVNSIHLKQVQSSSIAEDTEETKTLAEPPTPSV